MIDRTFARDTEDPCAQTQRRVVPVVRTPYLVEHALHDILDIGLLDITGQVGHDERAESPIAIFECLRFARFEPFPDVGVRGVHSETFVLTEGATRRDVAGAGFRRCAAALFG